MKNESISNEYLFLNAIIENRDSIFNEYNDHRILNLVVFFNQEVSRKFYKLIFCKKKMMK